MKNPQDLTYMSYMLRLWRDNPRASWRASLQNTATEQMHHFADAEQMWAYLNAQMEAEQDDSPGAPEGGAPE
jgi:hypothetical protein